MSKLNEREVALKTGGKYTFLKDYFDGLKVKQMPMNETQVLSGLSASDGVVIPTGIIPANAAIPDNKKISTGLLTTVANEGGIVASPGTITTGFVTPGTFVWENTTILDDYLNILNAVSIRDASTHDAIFDTAGREVFGLIVRLYGLADDSSVGANPVENLEICFFVSDSSGTLVKATGGVNGSVEFNLNRAFARRHEATVSLEGGNNIDVDIVQGVHYSSFTMTTAAAAGETLTLSTGVFGGTGVATYGGDVVHVALNSSAALFNADNTCKCTLNGVKGTKGTSLDFQWVSADSILILAALDITDIVGIERQY